MMKYVSVFVITIVSFFTLTACSFGASTMDQGKDTDGKEGEKNQTIQSEVGATIDDTKDAVKDAGRSVKNAADDVMDDSKRVIDDVTKNKTPKNNK